MVTLRSLTLCQLSAPQRHSTRTSQTIVYDSKVALHGNELKCGDTFRRSPSGRRKVPFVIPRHVASRSAGHVGLRRCLCRRRCHDHDDDDDHHHLDRWRRLAVVGVVPLDARDLLFLGALLLGHRWRHLCISEEEEDGGAHGSRCLRSTADLPGARGRSRTCAGATAATDDDDCAHHHREALGDSTVVRDDDCADGDGDGASRHVHRSDGDHYSATRLLNA